MSSDNQPGQPREHASVAIDGELLDAYFAAKQAIIFYETREGKQALAAVTELRDALDHIMLAAERKTEDARASELVSACEHLRRGAVEPLEHAVENRLFKLMRKRRLVTFCRPLFIPPPDREQSEFLVTTIQRLIGKGREQKQQDQWRDAAESFQQAWQYCVKLDLVLPDREVYLGRFFSAFLVGVGIALGALVTLLLKWITQG